MGSEMCIRDRDTDQSVMAEHGISPIDLVVVNLYPFQRTVAEPDCALEDAIENIDIGGPAMIRASAKNYVDVVVVTDPADYASLASAITEQGGTSEQTRFQLSQKAFAHTALYDAAIANYLMEQQASDAGESTSEDNPASLRLHFDKVQDLRYGENLSLIHI